MSRLRAHYVLSTHWDREWHQTFQTFRYRLVQLLDRVLAGLEDGRLRGPFQTDGQSIILEDYLEIRPDRRAQLEELAQQGGLVIGPWYVLPDEFLVSGESLVRNLRLGRAIARSFGVDPSQAGFVCDLFGHNSQMPQIFAGFGIHAGFIWRGLNHLTTRHVRWQGADGTEMLVYRFPGGGYCDYTFKVRKGLDHNTEYDPAARRQALQEYLEYEAERTEMDPMLLFDGGDHEEWDEEAYAALTAYMDEEETEFEIVHTSLDTYLEEATAQADRVGTVVEGELREPGRDLDDQQWVIPGVLSSRVWIKQENAACETLLCHWAEPTAAFAHLLLDRETAPGFLETAWRWLLKNHPHDSICGCSIDQVHRDMVFRFSQARQIADRLTDEATQSLAASIQGQVGEDELRLVLFNPLPYPLDEGVEITLPIPTEWPTFNEFFGFEPKPGFRIYDAGGAEVPYQRVRQQTNRQQVRLHTTRFPESYRVHQVTVSIPVTLPAGGYSALVVRAGEPRRPTRHPQSPSLVTSERSMENEFLRVTIAPNGTLTVTDKRSGQSYPRLLTFEDAADIGDGWYHGQAVNDEVFMSTGSTAAIALIHDGAQMAAFRIRTELQTPAAFRFDDSMARSRELVTLIVESVVRLRAGSERVEVQTTVHNHASDHRLRVLFPSGASTAQSYLADTPFDVVERPIALRADNHLYRELEVETRPQQTWSAVYADGRGVAVVAKGLLESAVRDQPERSLALTLFRSTRRTVFTDGEPDGQLYGDLVFDYWIMPLASEPDPVQLCRLGQQLATGVRAVAQHPADQRLHRTSVPLPPVAQLLAVDGPAILSSVRWVDGGLEVRCWNPTAAPGRVTITVDESLGLYQVQPVDLESKPLGVPEELVETAYAFTLDAKQITTLRFAGDIDLS